jgi:PPOX class probable F420-dependent enzyme
MADLGAERYVSITSFRRDGTSVATPVWVVAAAGRLYVWTGSRTGKARRIRNNPDVTLAPCTARGTVTGPVVTARAVIVPAEERPEVWSLLLAKYRLQLRAIVLVERMQKPLRRRKPSGQGERIYLELTVATPNL